jgi:hypothetical protein
MGYIIATVTLGTSTRYAKWERHALGPMPKVRAKWHTCDERGFYGQDHDDEASARRDIAKRLREWADLIERSPLEVGDTEQKRIAATLVANGHAERMNGSSSCWKTVQLKARDNLFRDKSGRLNIGGSVYVLHTGAVRVGYTRKDSRQVEPDELRSWLEVTV